MFGRFDRLQAPEILVAAGPFTRCRPGIALLSGGRSSRPRWILVRGRAVALSQWPVARDIMN